MIYYELLNEETIKQLKNAVKKLQTENEKLLDENRILSKKLKEDVENLLMEKIINGIETETIKYTCGICGCKMFITVEKLEPIKMSRKTITGEDLMLGYPHKKFYCFKCGTANGITGRKYIFQIKINDSGFNENNQKIKSYGNDNDFLKNKEWFKKRNAEFENEYIANIRGQEELNVCPDCGSEIIKSKQKKTMWACNNKSCKNYNGNKK